MKIVVDTNIVFSAILNSDGKIGDLLLNSGKYIDFYSAEFLRYEIGNHYGKLSKISKQSLKTTFYRERDISQKFVSLKKNMKNITIQVDIPSDLLVALNESEQELKSHFQTATAMMLFQEGKLTMGKAIQLSGLTRFDFYKVLAKNKIPVSNLDADQIISDADKLKEL